MSTMDSRDVALQSTLPTVMVPMFGPFEPLANAGNRILMARDGLWVEARRHGIYTRQKIARQTAVALPYGAVAEVLETEFSFLGVVLRDFVQMARDALPNEIAMALVWNATTRDLQRRPLVALSQSMGHIKYERPEVSEDEHVVLDMHSHGDAPAFFSRTDNADDRGDVKIAVVIGNVNAINPTVVARLCVLGHFRPLPISLSEESLRINEGGTNAAYDK
jgi:PRTRC genetic system protein A